jgi:hypothetical protein
MEGRFEVLAAVKMPTFVFWVIMPCGSQSRYQDESSMFLKNVGIYLQAHTVLQPRKPTSMMEGRINDSW